MYNPYSPYGGGGSNWNYQNQKKHSQPSQRQQGLRSKQQLPFGYEFNNIGPVPTPSSSFGGHPDGRKQGNIAFMGAGETLSDPRTSTKYEKWRRKNPTPMEKIYHDSAMNYSRIQNRANETYTKIIPHPRQNNGDPRVLNWMNGNYGSQFSGSQGGQGSSHKSRKRRSSKTKTQTWWQKR